MNVFTSLELVSELVTRHGVRSDVLSSFLLFIIFTLRCSCFNHGRASQELFLAFAKSASTITKIAIGALSVLVCSYRTP